VKIQIAEATAQDVPHCGGRQSWRRAGFGLP